jgi:hypothetical protein
MMQYVFIGVSVMPTFAYAFSIKAMIPFIHPTIKGLLLVSPQSWSYFKPMSFITIQPLTGYQPQLFFPSLLLKRLTPL